jgi:hypothetical protein
VGIEKGNKKAASGLDSRASHPHPAMLAWVHMPQLPLHSMDVTALIYLITALLFEPKPRTEPSPPSLAGFTSPENYGDTTFDLHCQRYGKSKEERQTSRLKTLLCFAQLRHHKLGVRCRPRGGDVGWWWARLEWEARMAGVGVTSVLAQPGVYPFAAYDRTRSGITDAQIRYTAIGEVSGAR